MSEESYTHYMYVVPPQIIVKKVDGDPVQDNINLNYIYLYDKIMSLQLNQNKLRKEYSPQLRTEIGKIIIESTIDEGSELNCVCSSTAVKCGIKFEPINVKAMAAGSNVMKVLGVVPYDLVLKVCDSKDVVEIVLRNAISEKFRPKYIDW